MAISSFSNGRKNVTVVGQDNLGQDREVQAVVRSDGIKAMAVDSRTVVESTFGFDQNPDTWFKIVNTGAEGDTWTIDIAATTNDPSAPDRDIPAYQKIFTVLAGEVGDEIKFRDRVIQELNADSVFKTTSSLKAVKATDRAIINIRSESFSLSGEFFERPNAGDFDVTVTGTAVVVIGFDNLISRSKPVSISRDFDSPHRLGLFGITGEVRVTAKELSDLFIEQATLDGLGVVKDLGVNGSGTAKEFIIPASTTTDLFIQELRLFGQGNGIQYKGWLTSNNPLNNGVLIEVQSDNVLTQFPVLFTTADIKNKFAFGLGATGFKLDLASGRDEFIGVFTFENPFIIRVAGTFTQDDYIKVTVRDNLTSTQSELEFFAKGFEKEP